MILIELFDSEIFLSAIFKDTLGTMVRLVLERSRSFDGVSSRCCDAVQP